MSNSYFQPKAVKVDNGNVIVIAHNLKDQTLVSWYLKSDKGGKFKVLTGEKGVTERKLFNFDNQGQLALNGNTMLYSQVSRKIIGDQEVRKTHIFKFDMAKVVEDLKSGKKDECLLGKKNCQINTASSITSNPGEINFLQYVKRTEGGDLVAFLAEDRLPNKQTLHLTSLVKNGSKSNFTVCEFADSIKQLYVKDNGQDSFIVTAISEENIAIFNHQRFEKPSKVTIIPASSIKTLSNFVNIINGRLTPDIISSSTVAPVTITETLVTSKKTLTAAITSTTETDTVKTTKLTTEASTTVAPTSTMSKPSTTQTSTVTVKPTTVAKTTTTSQATTVATTSTSVPSETETSTVKPTAATAASTSTMSKPSTESTTQTSTVTVEPTTEAVASTSTMNKPSTESTTQTSTVTVEPTVPTTSSEKTTQTVFIIPSTRTRESTTPIFTTTLLPQTTSSPQPTQLAIGSNRAGVIGGSLVGAIISIAGIIGFMAYKYVKGRNAAPVLELTDFNDRRRSSSSGNSDEEIFVASNRMSSYGSGTVLDSISVENSSRSRSSSSSSGSGPSS